MICYLSMLMKRKNMKKKATEPACRFNIHLLLCFSERGNVLVLLFFFLLAEALVPGVVLGGGSRFGTLEDTIGTRNNSGSGGELTVDVAASGEAKRDLCARVGALASAEIADHLGGARTASGAGGLEAGRLATELPVGLEGGWVGLEGLCDVVPPAGAQGLVSSDGDIGRVGLTGRVLEVPVGSCTGRVPGGGEVHVGDVGMGVKDVPGLGVDLVGTETGVEVGISGGGGSDPGGRDGVLGSLGTGSVGEGEFIVMGVSKELFGNDVGRVALDGLVVEVGPVHDAVGHGGADVTNDPDTITGILGSLKLGNEPLEFTVGVVVRSLF